MFVFNVKNRCFCYPSGYETPMIFRNINLQFMFDDVDIYNFVNNTHHHRTTQDWTVDIP